MLWHRHPRPARAALVLLLAAASVLPVLAVGASAASRAFAVTYDFSGFTEDAVPGQRVDGQVIVHASNVTAQPADAQLRFVVTLTRDGRAVTGAEIEHRAGDAAAATLITNGQGQAVFPGPDRPAYTPADFAAGQQHALAVVAQERGAYELAVQLVSGLSSGGVQRLEGPSRIETAVSVSRAAFPRGAPVAYVATARAFPDALAGAPSAAQHDGPILLTDATALPPATAEELGRLRPGRVVVLGGTVAVSDGVEARLAEVAGVPVERRAGATRFETAVQIAAADHPEGTETVYIATAFDFPDALSGSAAAACDGSPVLLVERDGIPAAVTDALRLLSPDRVVILGGTVAVGQAVEDDLRGFTPEVVRWAGSNRFETSAMVAANAFPGQAGTAYVATGSSFPDALAGGAAAGRECAPLLLTGDDLPALVAAELTRLAPARIHVLGGAVAVSERVEAQLSALAAPFAGTSVTVGDAAVTRFRVAPRPYILGVTPPDGATGVPTDLTSVGADVAVVESSQGVDPATLTEQTTRLERASDNAPVPAQRNTSGGNDAIVLVPREQLQPDTQYRFTITDDVLDLSGNRFLPFTSTFTTGAAGASGPGLANTTLPGVAFERVPLPATAGRKHTTLLIGPDHKLYASTITGTITRYVINADGTLGAAQDINSLPASQAGPRLLVGMAFDPASTPAAPILWVTHTQFGFDDGEDFTGRISRLSGPGLRTVQDVIVGLPRSKKDHVTNSLTFGPDGALYVLQGSNSGAGAPDATWGDREERLLGAALLRVDVDAVGAPLNVQTVGDGGSYDPFAPGAPVTLYATGIRNAYDMVWHSNGSLYVPANGTASGNTPASPADLASSTACRSRRPDAATAGAYRGPQVPGLVGVIKQHDWLFEVAAGGYYGHPNPTRCEWVLNGGNPTAGDDPADAGNAVTNYPVGTLPDRNYRGASFDFGYNVSPNGALEYQSDVFGGALRGRLLVTRYSGGDDLIFLRPGAAQASVAERTTDVPGTDGFVDPLDVVEDPRSGALYVSQFAQQDPSQAAVVLLRPAPGGAPPPVVAARRLSLENLDDAPFDDRLVFNRIGSITAPPANVVHDRATLRARNTGAEALTLTAATIGGPDAADWVLPSPPAFPVVLAPGAFVDLPVRFVAGAERRIHSATLSLASDDDDQPTAVVALSGWWQELSENRREPPLRRIVETFGYGTTIVGEGQQLNNTGLVEAVGDEVLSSYWRRLDAAQPVTVRQLAAFHTYPDDAALQWHPQGSDAATVVVVHDPDDAQSLLPHRRDATAPAAAVFAPTQEPFGWKIDGEWSDNTRNDGALDQRNGCTGATADDCGHHLRFWALRDRQGNRVPGSYLLSMDYAGVNYDYNDNLYLISNIAPAPADPTARPVAYDSLAAQPQGVSEAQGEAVGARLFVFGGFDSTRSSFTPTRRARVYDPTTDVWSPIADLPTLPRGTRTDGTAFGGVSHAGTATDGTDVFLAGGYTSNDSGSGQVFGTKQVWRYNVAANTYTRLPDLPLERAAGQLEYLDGSLHFFGGTNRARTTDVGNHWVLGPGAGVWTPRAPLPNPRHHMGAAVLDGRIYAIGGQHRHDGALTTQNDVHAYNPVTDSWSQVADLPRARGHISSSTFIFGGHIVVAGGERDHNAPIADVTVYRPGTNTWAAWTPLPSARSSGVAGALADGWVFTGGEGRASGWRARPRG